MSEKIEKIVELDIDDDIFDEELDDTGVEIVSLVDSPAIAVDFHYFSKQEFIEPNTNESEDDFIGRCMGDSKMVSEYPDEQQRLAVCYSYFEGGTEEELSTCEHHVLSDEAQTEILKFCEDDNNGYYIGTEDVFLDFTKTSFGVGDVIKSIVGLDILKRLTVKKDEPAEIYWRYSGPDAQRDFCRAMMNLARRGKIFSEEELDKMGSINAQFSKRGSSTYDKMAWKGGVNCVHYWQKLYIFKGNTGNKVIIATNDVFNERETNAMKSNNSNKPGPLGSVPNNARVNFSFSIDNEQRIVTGPLMIPNKMILRRQTDGSPFYIFFSRKTIKKMAEKFFKTNKNNNTDINHDENITNENTLLESWISESMTHDKSYKYGYMLPPGTWFVSYKINNDETWEKIKSGELKGFSLAGGFITKMKEVNPEKTLNEIKDILNQVK